VAGAHLQSEPRCLFFACEISSILRLSIAIKGEKKNSIGSCLGFLFLFKWCECGGRTVVSPAASSALLEIHFAVRAKRGERRNVSFFFLSFIAALFFCGAFFWRLNNNNNNRCDGCVGELDSCNAQWIVVSHQRSFLCM
jgi:hypothetical protein